MNSRNWLVVVGHLGGGDKLYGPYTESAARHAVTVIEQYYEDRRVRNGEEESEVVVAAVRICKWSPRYAEVRA